MRKTLCLVLLSLGSVSAVLADDAAPQATTAGDPSVQKATLQLQLKPLTQEELVVEADAWFALFRAKVAEISATEIAVKAANQKATEAKKKAGDGDDASGTGADEAAAGAAGDADAHQEEKKSALDRVNALREQRIVIGDRLAIVLDELEKKGGDRTSYDTYVSAVSAIIDPTVDVFDYDVVLNLVLGWLKSPEGGIRWGMNILRFIFTVIAFWFLSRIVSKAVSKSLSYAKNMSELLKQFAAGFVRRGVFLVGLVVALSQLEINIGPLLAVIGAAGFVIGFALQGTLSNFASGIMILAYRPFDVNDVIDAGGVSGTVESLNLVSTHIRTFDNRRIIVPNNSIWGDVITNVTGTPTRRVDLVFGIGYEDDMSKARQILEDILGKHEKVLSDPAPVVRVHELADSSVNLICRPWVRTSDYWDVYWDVTISAKQRFDAEGISIPFPQRDVHVHQVGSAEATAS
ncbi:MAG: mechanosensitive ion channel family protein [Phycisphaerae bacterium]